MWRIFKRKILYVIDVPYGRLYYADDATVAFVIANMPTAKVREMSANDFKLAAMN